MHAHKEGHGTETPVTPPVIQTFQSLSHTGTGWSLQRRLLFVGAHEEEPK